MKLLLFSLLVFLTGCISMRDATVEQMKHEYVNEFPNMSKTDIYNKCIRWIGINLKSSKNVIDVNDKESGTIIAKAYTNIDFRMNYSAFVSFSLMIDIKENKARFRFVPTGFTDKYNNDSPFPEWADWHLTVKERFDSAVESLSKFIATKDEFLN